MNDRADEMARDLAGSWVHPDREDDASVAFAATLRSYAAERMRADPVRAADDRADEMARERFGCEVAVPENEPDNAPCDWTTGRLCDGCYIARETAHLLRTYAAERLRALADEWAKRMNPDLAPVVAELRAAADEEERDG